ncbi:MAG: ABC transporter ATP-binding protein [Kiritimatiellaeota bacterium]|nr:ABC transporter ATP-binding protein [Kiritimatiellota bacterium]
MKTPFIRLQEVVFAYDGGPRVLDGVDLELAPGGRIALTGRNGSGKTTLLHMIVGLLRPVSGRIEAFGRERCCEQDFHEVRRRAGLLFQDPDDQLFCPTVAEDVAFGPLNLGKSRDEVWERVRKTLEELGLSGYEDRITYRLSGGEKRLVSLATVLAMQPDVLLLDEPTSGLDAETEERLADILHDLPQAMIVASHDRRFIEKVTQWEVRLEQGKLRPGNRSDGQNLPG